MVDKWQLRPHLRTDTEIVEARFDEAAGVWTLVAEDGERFAARVVISCVGGLVDPKLPDIKGLASYRGELFHTARWNHDYDLVGRRVAVIGTGASAVQVVPAIAPAVEQLYVFQRTPGWVMPKDDAAYSQRSMRIFERYPLSLALSRLAKYALYHNPDVEQSCQIQKIKDNFASTGKFVATIPAAYRTTAVTGDHTLQVKGGDAISISYTDDMISTNLDHLLAILRH